MAFTTKKSKVEQIEESLETIKYMAECALEDLKTLSPVRTQQQDFRLECALQALGQLKGEGQAHTPWGWIKQTGELVLNPLAGLLWGFATVYSSLTDEKNAQYYKQTPVKVSMVHDNGIGFMVIDHDMSTPSVLWSSRHDSLTELAELPEWEATLGITAEELKNIQDNFGHKDGRKIPYIEMANTIREHLIPNCKEIKVHQPYVYVPPVHVPYQAKVETVGSVAPLGDKQTPHPALGPSATQDKIEAIRAGIEELEDSLGDDVEDLEDELVSSTPGAERAIGFFGCE